MCYISENPKEHSEATPNEHRRSTIQIEPLPQLIKDENTKCRFVRKCLKFLKTKKIRNAVKLSMNLKHENYILPRSVADQNLFIERFTHNDIRNSHHYDQIIRTQSKNLKHENDKRPSIDQNMLPESIMTSRTF